MFEEVQNPVLVPLTTLTLATSKGVGFRLTHKAILDEHT